MSAVGVWSAALVGAVVKGAVDKAAPRLMDHFHPLGTTGPGFAPHFEAGVGAGEGFSKPAGQY